MNIDTTNAEPVFGYSNNGKHLAPINVVQWVGAELREAREVQAELNAKCKAQDYDEYEDEIARHEQDGFVSALEYVQRYIENR